MKTIAYFHTNYVSFHNMRHYVNVSVVLDGRGAFGVKIDKENHKVEMYTCLEKDDDVSMQVTGIYSIGMYDKYSIADVWNGLDASLKDDIKQAVNLLTNAFVEYIKIDRFTNEDVFYMLKYLRDIKEYVDDNCNSNGNAEATVHDEGGLEVKSTAHDARHSSKMAYIIDNTDLNEFVNGCFYPFVKAMSYNGKNYIVIKNDNGEERTIDEKRANIINVYDEPPAV